MARVVEQDGEYVLIEDGDLILEGYKETTKMLEKTIMQIKEEQVQKDSSDNIENKDKE